MDDKKLKLTFLSVYFSILYLTSIYFFKIGLFSANDVFFASDTYGNLRSFAHGWNWGRAAISHTLIEYFAIPIRVLQISLSYLGLIEDPKPFREILALSISPLFSTLTIFYFYKILFSLGFDEKNTAIYTLIFAFSFTNIIFGVIPETFAISCFLITVLIYSYIRTVNNKNVKYLTWILLSFFIPGITITNSVIFFITYFMKKYTIDESGLLRSFCSAMGLTVLGLTCVIVLFFLNSVIFRFEPGGEGGVEWITKYLSYRLFFDNFISLIVVSFNSLVALNFNFIDHHLYSHLNELSFGKDSSILWVVLLILFCFIVLTNYLSSTRQFKNIILVSTFIISYNFLFHMLFGQEMMLYTQHWITPLIILLSLSIHKNQTLSYCILTFVFILNLKFFLFDLMKVMI